MAINNFMSDSGTKLQSLSEQYEVIQKLIPPEIQEALYQTALVAAKVQNAINHSIAPVVAEIISRYMPTQEERQTLIDALQKFASIDHEKLKESHENFEHFVNDKNIPEKAKTYVLQLSLVECRQVINDYYSRPISERIEMLFKLEHLGQDVYRSDDNAGKSSKNNRLKWAVVNIMLGIISSAIYDAGKDFLQEFPSALQELVQASEQSQVQPARLSETQSQAQPIAGCQHEEPPQDRDPEKNEDPGCPRNTQ